MNKIKREILRGFFVLEGIDGAGTTTQLRKIEDRARTQGLNFRADFEPTPHPIGTLIRSIFRGEVSAQKTVLPYLFAADRQEHLDGPAGVRRFLAGGGKLLCDRYLFSSLAYQSQDSDWETVFHLNAAFPFPEVVFFFDLPISVAQSRIESRGQARELFEEAPTQEKIQNAYKRAFTETNNAGYELIRLDARRTVDELNDLIWERICR